jgi:outer membrane protein assembly factor BamA
MMTPYIIINTIQRYYRHGVNIILVLMCCFLISIGRASAQDALPEGDQLSPDSQKTNEESKEEDFQKWAFFPVIASETETGLQFGGLAVRFFEPESIELRTSTIDLVAFGTANQQYYTGISSDLYMKKDLYHLNFFANGRLWPANYYGMGSNSLEEDKEKFESTGFRTSIIFERKFADIFYAGAQYKFENSWIDPDSPEPQGTLTNGSITGAEGGLRSGLGATASLDTRDNINDSREGTLIKAQALYFEDCFGSDFDYSLYTLDMRKFITLAKITGLGIRGYAQLQRGDIPFQDLSSPDGYSILRGIERGRYRDRDMVAFQAEWRYPIYKRFSGTLFVETAQVADDLADLYHDNWISGAGAGLRWAINPTEKFNTRIDFAWVDNGFGLTIGMREAF